MRPHHAVFMAAALNLAGTFAGTAVAATIGKQQTAIHYFQYRMFLGNNIIKSFI